MGPRRGIDVARQCDQTPVHRGEPLLTGFGLQAPGFRQRMWRAFRPGARSLQPGAVVLCRCKSLSRGWTKPFKLTRRAAGKDALLHHLAPSPHRGTVMKTLRAFAAVSIVMLVAACSSTPEKAAPAKAPPAAAAANVAGSWTVTVDSPMGKRDSEAQFSQNGEALTGKMISQRGEVPFSGTVKGNAVAFAFQIDMQGQP